MKSKHLTIFIVAIAVLIMAPMVQSADTIRIGWTADMPGIGATFYESQKKAVELFIEDANAAGGILGQKLELIIRDSKLKPDVGATVARELILSEKCEFLIGPTSSGVALAVAWSPVNATGSTKMAVARLARGRSTNATRSGRRRARVSPIQENARATSEMARTVARTSKTRASLHPKSS